MSKKHTSSEQFSIFGTHRIGFVSEGRLVYKCLPNRACRKPPHRQSGIKTYPLPPIKASSAELYKNAPTLFQSINIFETEAELISRLRLDMKAVQSSYFFMEKPSQSFEMLALKIKTIQNAAYLGTGEPMSFFESILDRESDESILFNACAPYKCLRL